MGEVSGWWWWSVVVAGRPAGGGGVVLGERDRRGLSGRGWDSRRKRETGEGSCRGERSAVGNGDDQNSELH